MSGGLYWLASYPKSGNTWVRAFIANLTHTGPGAVDINALDTGAIASSRHWIEATLGFDTTELSHGEIDRLRPARRTGSRRNRPGPSAFSVRASSGSGNTV